MVAPYERPPFPYNILEDAGIRFAIGAIASCPYHFIKGPMGTRLEYITMMAPRTGGSFAVWSSLMATMSGGLAHVRHKEDPWNSILAGGFTSALLSIRKGFRPAFTQFLIGGAALACIEGVTIMSHRQFEASAVRQSQSYPQYSVPSPVPVANKSVPRWLRRRFGTGKDDDVRKNEGDVGKTKVLESVDTLPPPMPTFHF